MSADVGRYDGDPAVCGYCGVCAVCDRPTVYESATASERRDRRRVAETLIDRGLGVRAIARMMRLRQVEVRELVKLESRTCQCGPRAKFAAATCARCGLPR